ncbi:MAG: biotin/lipoate A/B protein ligase family protein [bacterium]|nr:biotin/lipoate A/B protein ligase family protein [bacterium]
MNIWRLIVSPPLDGASNMALDEALFNRNATPTLRFYFWKRPTISVGRFQRLNDDFIDKCKEASIDIVRRPTGGRAILHNSELTYSVSAPYSMVPESSSLASLYTLLAEWQVDSLAAMGIKASLAGKKGAGRRYIENNACFLSSTSFEVNVGGRKICGSAQRRGKNYFLQHGSILIDYDFDLFPSLLKASSAVETAFTTLRKEGCHLSEAGIIDIMKSEFEKKIPCTLQEGGPSQEELKEMHRLETAYNVSFNRFGFNSP